MLFYVRYWTETLVKLGQLVALIWRVNQIRRRVLREHSVYGYTDVAIAKLSQRAENDLEIMRDRPRLAVAEVG